MITKEQLNNLSIMEQIETINDLLNNNLSLTKISNEIGISRATITKRFKANGYIFDKTTNQFVLNEPIESHLEPLETNSNINMLSIDIKDFMELKQRVDILEKAFETLQNKYNGTTTNELQNNDNMINFYNGADTIRSLRIDYEVWEKLKNYMSRNKQYRQKDIISNAINDFLNKYDK